MSAPVPTPNWVHKAQVIRVIDGDTFVARIDLGRFPTKVYAEASIRINGLWCPELDEPGGSEARIALLGLIDGYATDKTLGRVVIQTRKPNPSDVYGRIVADVWNSKGQSLAAVMIENGHGKEKK